MTPCGYGEVGGIRACGGETAFVAEEFVEHRGPDRNVGNVLRCHGPPVVRKCPRLEESGTIVVGAEPVDNCL